MFGEECTSDTPDSITSPYAIWVRDALEEAYEQVRQHSGQAVQRQKPLYDRRSVKRLFAVGDWGMRFYTPAKKCKLDSAWIGPYLIVSLIGWALGIQKDPESPILIVHCQDTGGRILVSNKEIIDCTIGYDSGCQHYATNVAKFTFVNGGASGRRNNDC